MIDRLFYIVLGLLVSSMILIALGCASIDPGAIIDAIEDAVETPAPDETAPDSPSDPDIPEQIEQTPDLYTTGGGTWLPEGKWILPRMNNPWVRRPLVAADVAAVQWHDGIIGRGEATRIYDDGGRVHVEIEMSQAGQLVAESSEGSTIVTKDIKNPKIRHD